MFKWNLLEWISWIKWVCWRRISMNIKCIKIYFYQNYTNILLGQLAPIWGAKFKGLKVFKISQSLQRAHFEGWNYQNAPWTVNQSHLLPYNTSGKKRICYLTFAVVFSKRSIKYHKIIRQKKNKDQMPAANKRFNKNA